MVVLRNNIYSEDARLDRLVEFDVRSKEYPMTALTDQKSLRSYTWRCNEFFDQGKEGACVAYALGHELAARPAEVIGINDRWLKEKIYWEAQKIDPWEGGSYPGAKSFYEGTSVLAGVKVLHHKKFFKEYKWAFRINDLLVGLGYNGPSVLGINWYQGMSNTDDKGFIHPTGRVVGGHAILARAINVKEERVTLRNSWGFRWGHNGDCYISFSDLDRLLREQGEAVFLIERTKKFHNASIEK